MPELPLFQIAPPPRCCATVESAVSCRCGERARWTRQIGPLDVASYYCDEHRAASDVLIAGELSILRVHFQLEVYITGVAVHPKDAKAEAYDRLEREVRRLGGAMGLVSVHAEIGRGRFQVDARRGGDRRGRG